MSDLNSTDATRGQPLGERTLARIAELEAGLAELEPDAKTERDAIELALGTGRGLITGDLAHPSDAVAADLNTWLERNKHLVQRQTTPPNVN